MTMMEHAPVQFIFILFQNSIWGYVTLQDFNSKILRSYLFSKNVGHIFFKITTTTYGSNNTRAWEPHMHLKFYTTEINIKFEDQVW